MFQSTAHEVRAPQAVYVRAYTALESARLAAKLMRAAIDAERIDDEDADDQPLALSDVAAVVLACESLQERVTAPRLTVPERAIKVIANWKNRWPLNPQGLEAVSLALTLAAKELDKAVDILVGMDRDSFYWLLLGAWDVFAVKSSCVGSCIAYLDVEETLADIIAGRSLPPFATDADVAAAKLEWARHGL